MTQTLNTPDFKTEKEEAEWWDSHPDEVLALLEQAAKDGTLGRGTLARRAAVREGIAAADRGELIEDDAVRQWLEKRERP